MAAHAADRAPARIRRSAAFVGDPILTSKITAPSVPAWAVERPRITELIAEGTRWCPLTVVTGPPGAGKTMAVALWAAAETRAVAWVGLDEFDSRPGVFWAYVAAALRGPAWPCRRFRLPGGGGTPGACSCWDWRRRWRLRTRR